MLRIERVAVRAVVLTPAREVLLLRDRSRGYWFTPGGGLEVGETDEQCLRRELREELGIEQFELGLLLGRQRYVRESVERRTEHRQHIYLVEHARFEPRMSDPVEVLSIDGMRWWQLGELLETPQQVYPVGLARRVQRYLDHGETHAERWQD